jgi:phosphatidylglycerophosphatase C
MSNSRISATPAARRVVAVFDFDGTLSTGTSGLRFFRQLLGSAGVAWMVVRHLPSAVAYGLRYRHEECLDRFNHYVFRGRRADEVIRVAGDFARHAMPRELLPAGMARLRAHQARGDRCVIVSRAYAWCLEPWARTVGVTEVIGTRLEVGPDGRLTGRMLEPSCDGEHKRARLLALLGARDRWEVHVYGDSAGDHAMFDEADRAFVRRGDGFLPWAG